jgi:hypothetical protein
VCTQLNITIAILCYSSITCFHYLYPTAVLLCVLVFQPRFLPSISRILPPREVRLAFLFTIKFSLPARLGPGTPFHHLVNGG